MSSVALYQTVCMTATGKEATLRTVATPFIEDEPARALAKAPTAKGPCIECEWCGHTLPDDDRYKNECYDHIKRTVDAAKKMQRQPNARSSPIAENIMRSSVTVTVNMSKAHVTKPRVPFSCRYYRLPA